MAKSVRASVQKRNKAKLRATVFGPVVDARTERLSAKLQELASQPKPSDSEKSNSNIETDMQNEDGQGRQTRATRCSLQHNLSIVSSLSRIEMDIDTSRTSGKPRSGRIQKRQRKNRSSILFKPHPSKNRKIAKKK
ncbi:hypothetical protein BJX64DRAFT_272029 [Aspergillus heterothallicus]